MAAVGNLFAMTEELPKSSPRLDGLLSVRIIMKNLCV